MPLSPSDRRASRTLALALVIALALAAGLPGPAAAQITNVRSAGGARDSSAATAADRGTLAAAARDAQRAF